MKRTRSSSKNLNLQISKKLRTEFASEVVTEVINELKDIKLSRTKENLNLFGHIQDTLRKLNNIKKQVVKKSISNESIEYLEELDEDFLQEIYKDVDSSSDSEYNNQYIDYISDDEFENHPFTF